jgi:hypothetical protein
MNAGGGDVALSLKGTSSKYSFPLETREEIAPDVILNCFINPAPLNPIFSLAK